MRLVKILKESVKPPLWRVYHLYALEVLGREVDVLVRAWSKEEAIKKALADYHELQMADPVESNWDATLVLRKR